MYNRAKSGFSIQEYRNRIQKVINYLQKTGVDGYLMTNPSSIHYFGHYYMAGKRPVVFYIHKSAKVYAFVPAMEYQSAAKLLHLNRVLAYDDHVADINRLYRFIRQTLTKELTDTASITVDVVTDIEKLQALEDLFSRVLIHDEPALIRQIKTPEEIDMLRLSAMYSDFMVDSCRRHLIAGITELGILNRAITDTVDRMCDDGIQVIYVEGGPAGALLPSGPNTALPHALPSQRIVRQGDNLLFSCGANVWGYRTESERTVFYGDPAAAYIEPFDVMRQAQQLGISLMRPGAVCSEIEQKVKTFIEDAGYGHALRHRTGHSKGLEEHEAPYIAAGDRTVMQPGMIFSSEPGLYIDGFAGFRHSDTVLITEDGCEALTRYPKELDDLIIPV